MLYTNPKTGKTKLNKKYWKNEKKEYYTQIRGCV